MSESYIAEPLDRCFLVQATDEVYSLNLIDDNSLRALFALNCLFFDSIVVGASDLLGNPAFYSMLRDERNATSQLYRSSAANGEEVIQPILMGDHETVTSVAEGMIAGNTIHNLSGRDELMEHAQMIDDAKPEYLWCPEHNFRLKYYENMVNISQYLNADGLKAWSHQEQQFPIGSLTKLSSWLAKTASKDDLRCSSVYRFADENMTGHFRAQVKLLAEATYQYTLSQMQMAALSTPREYAPIIDRIRFISTDRDHIVPKEFRQEELGSQKARTSLPLQLISNLPLEHIMILRSLRAFKKVRGILSDFRSGRRLISALVVQRALDECEYELIQYISRNQLQREIFIKDLSKKKWHTVVKIVSPPGGIGLLMVLTSAGLSELLAVPLAVIVSVALVRFGQNLSRGETGPNIIHPEALDPQVEYYPEDGSIRKRS